MKQGIFDFVSQ